ncbi:DEAD-box ATP-dependent RNA helicase CshA [Thalassoglobus neptunius]|uniref:DEAD-box ATP-dependent RNA helicase CshA n=1 Tax=Thalassoglobus neptunius TaxID=1938619 RepID=A0A5C5VMN4_9PLAN|nr:DEAD/DEAH box helicase [Thalassoglobus neptunius]TWT39926.1 DEAD-box ATP-dependent RNA helicase CshA [Thalassoglobus neptunius]
MQQQRLWEEDTLSQFHPVIQDWFRSRFAGPTDPQRSGWPHIAKGDHTLIAAPTGSGKTLTAFLAIIDRLFRMSLSGEMEPELHVIYLSPLRALSNDMEKNLTAPLEEIYELARRQGLDVSPISVRLRTGDTPSHRRAAMTKKPPHILVTTPESLFLLLTAERSREILRSVRTVIIDEIHALVRDKRGSHLALSLERLEALATFPLQRIGLSATQKPISRMAEFLIGQRASNFEEESSGEPELKDLNCQIVDVGHQRDLDLGIETPPSELSAVCSHEQWAEVNSRLVELIQNHRSTLIFVNTRRLAERVTHQLTELLGEDAVASHHGSLSKEIRHSTEQRLKSGELKAVVATASLELGIDVGFIDLVIQLGSPRSIAAFLQRIGRSGHALGLVPKGRLFALTRDELVECMALFRAIRAGRLDVTPIPEAPLDILAQQIVGEVANQEWDIDDLFNCFRRAWPYQKLTREKYQEVLQILSTGVTDQSGRGRALIHFDHVNRRIKGRKAARLIAMNNSGAIGETDLLRVVLEDENTVVGTVDEEFGIESSAGDIFLLGNSSWRIQRLRGNDLIVSDAHGAPPTIPFWRGEAPGRTIELSEEISNLREELEEKLIAVDRSATDVVSKSSDQDRPDRYQPIVDWLVSETHCDESAAWQTVMYIAAQRAAVGVIPTTRKVVFERFFDESGGMQLVVHAPFGGRINRAWGLSFRKRFCRSFDFELQASADDDGFILSLGPQHSFPIESLFPMMRPDNAQNLLEQALLVDPTFHLRWRWNVTRSLFVDRMRNGKKVPPALQRFRSEDLLTAVFPKLTGCQENITGDHEIPSHPLVQQTMEDCLREALDIEGLVDVLERVDRDEITYVGRDTREPSPFAYELLNANPYAFLDGGEVQERRARAVATRRSLSIDSVRDLGKLDPEAIRAVVAEVQPLIRNEDELHDALVTRFLVPVDDRNERWVRQFCFRTDEHQELIEDLADQSRIVKIESEEGLRAWVPVECWPAVQLLWPNFQTENSVAVPSTVRQQWNESEALVAVLRGFVETSGPVTAVEIADVLHLPVSRVMGGLIALEGEGIVLRGRFLNYDPDLDSDSVEIEWCHRRLLARIHRRTISGLRKEIEAVSPAVYQKFLERHHGATKGHQRTGTDGVFEAIAQLQGIDLPAASWEESVLPQRIAEYQPAWLDELCLSGEIGWGRLGAAAKKKTAGRPMASVTKAVPVSIFLREDVDWLSDSKAERDLETLSDSAKEIVGLLQTRGALFARDLLELTNHLPTQLDDYLGELVSHGWITADGFSGLRKLTQTRAEVKTSRRRPSRQRQRQATTQVGRWTLCETADPQETDGKSDDTAISRDELVEQWAWQLIRRWGVVFRELVLRESLAPQWWELLRVFRRLEARGEIRGGRFVSGVGGEQFALGEAIRELRTLRSDESEPQLTVFSAADPLNLTGVIGPGKRIPALAGNRIATLNGSIVATKKSDEVWMAETLSESDRQQIAMEFGLIRKSNSTDRQRMTDRQEGARKRSTRKRKRPDSGIPKPFPF